MKKSLLKTSIKKYKSLDKKGSLEVKPIWAFDNNLFRDFDGYIFAWANVCELVKKSEFGAMGGEINPYVLFSERENGNQRIAEILYRWENGMLVDPPTIHCDRFGTIKMSDGRHRLITAFHLGEEQIPVAIDTSNKETISKFLDLELID